MLRQASTYADRTGHDRNLALARARACATGLGESASGQWTVRCGDTVLPTSYIELTRGGAAAPARFPVFAPALPRVRHSPQTLDSRDWRTPSPRENCARHQSYCLYVGTL